MNLTPLIAPVAEHRVVTGAAAAAALAPAGGASDAATLPGIGWPTLHALANAVAEGRYSSLSPTQSTR